MSDATQHGISSYLPDEKEKRKGTAFCMSGGGYRAALFHLGALRRLNELGLLASIDTFTSVSGGSIMASQLATFMAGAKREPGKPVDGFDEGVAEPMRVFAGKDVRTGAALARLKPSNWLVPGAQSEALAAAYAEGPAPGRLADLPETPRFVFLASDMRFRDQWVFDTGLRRIGSSSAGYGELGTWTLAQAVPTPSRTATASSPTSTSPTAACSTTSGSNPCGATTRPCSSPMRRRPSSRTPTSAGSGARSARA